VGAARWRRRAPMNAERQFGVPSPQIESRLPHRTHPPRSNSTFCRAVRQSVRDPQLRAERGRDLMPKYLFEASYTPEAVEGIRKAGAASRAAVVSDMCSELGGKLDSFHFAFGDVDAFVVCDLPDDEAAAAAAFTVGASGVGRITTIKLLTIEEADAALRRSVSYRPPGS
jgi:uncharacterized protein with GYD domain